MMKIFILVLGASFVLLSAGFAQTQLPNNSEETETCISCHKSYTPGIVYDWLESRHSKTTPEDALEKPKLERRISNPEVAERLRHTTVGCYECHGLNPQMHEDNFAHFGFDINVIVSPNDCMSCHPVEVQQYSTSIKAHAVGNLADNPLYTLLVETIIGLKTVEDTKVVRGEASDLTKRETCYGCHGTVIKVDGMKKIETEAGEIEVPNLSDWPNQGVGRVNPDGSRGACSSCHPRHAFSLKDARKLYTCAQCHLDPDVPAYNVYKESKHGNIYYARESDWNFENVPWTLGRDFKTPTCAVCHSSLIADEDGNVIAERTHNFDSRMWVRIFGLPYAHPHPKEGNTNIIKNADGLPLPTTFLNQPASDYLIDSTEMGERQGKMEGICQGCHSTDWVEKHFQKFDGTVKETNQMVLSATQLLLTAWDKKLADKENPFDEEIEILWLKQWLFYPNSIRYASAMTGAPDYAAFKLGWWELSEKLQQMKNWIELREK
jgi:hydroxylamine dehydrogenase